jgi:hypothetical protein
VSTTQSSSFLTFTSAMLSFPYVGSNHIRDFLLALPLPHFYYVAMATC